MARSTKLVAGMANCTLIAGPDSAGCQGILIG